MELTKDSNFMKDYMAAKIRYYQVEEYVQYWKDHELGLPLKDFLGLTEEEYKEWEENGDEFLIQARCLRLGGPPLERPGRDDFQVDQKLDTALFMHCICVDEPKEEIDIHSPIWSIEITDEIYDRIKDGYHQGGLPAVFPIFLEEQWVEEEDREYFEFWDPYLYEI